MRISGLNSGLDIEQIVSDLVRAQRIPMDRVYQQKVLAEWKRDAYREVNSKLLRFRNLAWDFTLQGTFLKKTAVSSRPEILTAAASGTAAEGRYDLRVEQLAEAARFVATNVQLPQPASGEGEEGPGEPESFSFSIGTSADKWATFTFAAGTSLEDIAAAINAKKLGIHAFAQDGQISFTTTATGAEAKFFVDGEFLSLFGTDLSLDQGDGIVIDEEGDQLYALQEGGSKVTGQDAQVAINGVTASYSTNTFTFNGITVNLLAAEADTTVVIEVKQDVDAVVEKVKEFVNLYNELVSELNGLLREEVYRNFAPLTEEQREAMSDKEIELWETKAKSGLLRSDSILRSVLSDMRTALSGVVQREGAGSVGLREIGITTGAWYEYGKLYLNEDKLRAALEENPDAVRDLFTQQGESEGLARRLTAVLDRSMDRITDTAGKATIPYDQSFLGNRIREYESRLSAMEERLQRYEEQQWRKFTAMEKALGQLYAQSDWLYQQLMAMQG
ncbi:MAG TPA: flagellar filament capping protein FliD [Limnochordia bacterium]|nr:flagellar filament capping protein FliD [Limnochordia bacterium]